MAIFFYKCRNFFNLKNILANSVKISWLTTIMQDILTIRPVKRQLFRFFYQRLFFSSTFTGSVNFFRKYICHCFPVRALQAAIPDKITNSIIYIFNKAGVMNVLKYIRSRKPLRYGVLYIHDISYNRLMEAITWIISRGVA